LLFFVPNPWFVLFFVLATPSLFMRSKERKPRVAITL
jgi:hypothetical protein